MSARAALLLVGAAFGIWEAVDVFWIDTPAVAAVFAVLFLAATARYRRRDSLRAAVALLLLIGFGTAVAPTLRAETVTKASAVCLGLAGIAAASTVLARRRRALAA
ncbi:MAG: hypothetical protein ACXVZ4_13475 [Gaiellaceae bacterium]